MRTNAISTLSFWNTPRTGVSRMQSDLANANQELVSGRFADVGLTLGSRTSLALGLRQTSAQLAALRDGNDIASLRLSTTQAALKQMQAGADATLKTLNGVSIAQRAAAVKDGAANQLAALTAALNTSAGGQFVFGGTNSGQSPVATYGGAPASEAKKAVDAAFLATFGFAQGDPAASTITGPQMKAFLDGPFAALFDASGWASKWSDASDRTLDSRISLTETVQTSTGANASAVRQLAMAYVMASDLGLSGLSADAQTVATDRVIGLLGSASSGLVATQADLGRSQAAITDANTRIEAQKTLLTTQLNQMEGVDQAEAKSRVDRLTTQVQVSYSLTAQLRQLSLVSYL